MKVAFFGLGMMGAPMVKNLLKAGYNVSTCFHPSQNMDLVKDITAFENFHTCSTNEEAAQDADCVFTSLPADKHITGFLINDSFAASLKEGAVLVETSSCTTQTMEAVADYYADKKVTVIDAPISGGVLGAEVGSLTIIAAGSSEGIDRVRPLLEIIGDRIFQLDRCGEGKTFKNLNNLLLAVNLLAATEMFRIAKKRGIDMERLYEVVCQSSGASTALKERWKRMEDGNFSGGFKVSLARKDLESALTLAEGIPVPLAALTCELMLANQENDDLDLAAMLKLFD